MSKALGFAAFLAVVVLGPILYFAADVSLPDLLALGGGALSLLWLIVLLTVPWGLYFQARTLMREIVVSRERGIEVPEHRDGEARRIARRLLLAAIGAHVLSALVTAVITFFSGHEVGYYFAGFYLLSTLFRPCQAYFSHLRRQLSGMLREVKHPREDVIELGRRVDALETATRGLEERIAELVRADAELREVLVEVKTGSAEADERLARRIEAMGRRFEDTVTSMTDNAEVIAGIKAFLRLMRAERAADGG